jgi:hypothetical protein
MKSCSRCGSELEEGQICGCTAFMSAAAQIDKSETGKIFESMKNRMGIGSPERNAADTYERGQRIVPDSIKPDEGEIPIRQYNIAVLRNLLKFERAEGRMQITNKRVIFRAAGRCAVGRTTLQHEFSIAEIGGIEARNNYKFSLMYFIFALLIIAFSIFIVYSGTSIFSDIMSPQHIQMVRAEERDALLRSDQAQNNLSIAINERRWAAEREQQAFNARLVAERNETANPSGRCTRDFWSNTTSCNRDFYKNQRIAAQTRETAAVAEREAAERKEALAITERDIAVERAAEATRKREAAEKTWSTLMTLLGLVLGVGGLLPFFLLYKRFGLKLFMLNISIFGFALALTASGKNFGALLLLVSFIVTIICVFLYCFRPNMVICVKNKSGIGDGAVDVRRDTPFTRHLEKGTGFAEIMPTVETEGAIREVGAIISDIQKLGDFGIQKWVKK